VSGFDKLELNTETIRDLTADELDRVAGGARLIPTWYDGCVTGIYPSIECTRVGTPPGAA
jgi:hypothetical protein